ncbi:SCO3374 family protein [Streptomyces sp. NBC_01210]|uniref:SCO3374 family protein n=1 Tax=Streptomyces sp. NBC_01210 TaxID=2903774 RepID=UPI002E10D5BB|nr:SCO3374 family protein [Streptomyces sp. NBC_01210]
MAFTVPLPRASFDGGTAQWYENELGWAVADCDPVQLLTGLRFDVLELPADAGAAVLRRTGPAGPVALMGQRMRLLVAVGSADELPGLLDWLEWGGIALDLTAIGAGGRMTAPPPPGWSGSREAAVWLRPPVPGREVEPTLPALAPFGRSAGSGGGISPDLVRLVDTAATECHRARLLRTNTPQTNTQPLAFS